MRHHDIPVAIRQHFSEWVQKPWVQAAPLLVGPCSQVAPLVLPCPVKTGSFSIKYITKVIKEKSMCLWDFSFFCKQWTATTKTIQPLKHAQLQQ